MRCLITAGPTWEPLDQVRRLTNFSTGSLGGELANHLAECGFEVSLLLGEASVWSQPLGAVAVSRFSTTESLRLLLQAAATDAPVAIFHAAAVSDFSAGRVFRQSPDGSLHPVVAGKLDTRSGNLLAELRPTPKLLPRLREWFPAGKIFGWKYEVDGTRDDAVRAARRQLDEAASAACVLNGPAFGAGFGLLQEDGSLREMPGRRQLYRALATELLRVQAGTGSNRHSPGANPSSA